ncbi:SH3 domain-containing protein [Pradoshia sp. D12]|uniref:SH3 domain-containing protein n=1 Tax=Pradoshia sp. D12 TaxID=2651284 RepID=UPI00178C44D0|nr:SH3 domain-containing protein [Pradoshia sp. D12]
MILLMSGLASFYQFESNLTEAAAVTYYQTTENVNMRTGASTKKAVVLTISKGKQVTYISRSGKWYKVKYGTKTGYISSSYLKKISVAKQAAASTKTVVTYQTTSNLNLRSKASIKGKILATIPKGKTVSYLSKSGTWYKVKYGTKTGYLSSKYVKKVTAKVKTPTNPVKTINIVTTKYQTTAGLNMRTSASSVGKVVTTIPKGKIVSATAKSGDWYKIKYGNKNGWVSGFYLKEYYSYKSTNTTYYSFKKASNLHTTPDTKKARSYTIAVNNIFASTQKVVNSKGETWYRVSYKGKNYFIFSKNVSKINEVNISKTIYQAKSATSLYKLTGSVHGVLSPIPKGKQVIAVSRIGNWYKTSYAGKTGYIDISNFSKVSEIKKPIGQAISPRVITTITQDLNYRQSDTASSESLGKLPNRTSTKTSYKTNNGWYEINYKGKTGYVSGEYLIDEDNLNLLKNFEKKQNPYLFLDLRKKSSVTAEQINNYISSKGATKGNSVLYGKGQIFINAANIYGVNALYLAAHAIHESGFGKSAISNGKNNLFGFGSYDITPFIGSVKFSSIDENIKYIAREMKATYLNEENWKYNGAYLGYTIKNVVGNRVDDLSEGMNFYYASDSKWGEKIAAHMNKILSYENEEGKNSNPNTTVYSRPNYPSGKDIFSKNTYAIAKTAIKISNKQAQAVIKKGESFNLIEKSNDYQLTVIFKGKVYNTNNYSLSAYNKYFSVKNLARVDVDLLNIMPTPNTMKTPIVKLKKYQYVELAIDSKKNPVSSGNWYKVILSNGKQGWVSKKHIIRELY